MTEEKNRQNAELMELTADIVAAFVQNNAVPVAGLPDLISSVNSALVSLVKPAVVEQPTQTPAVNPKKSVFPDHIISLEDGRKFKSLKRHLGLLGMTPKRVSSQVGAGAGLPYGGTKHQATRHNGQSWRSLSDLVARRAQECPPRRGQPSG